MQIYLTVNILNKKWYIGKDSKNRARYLGSGTALKRAVQRYGRQYFKKFILEHCTNIEELNRAEQSWIRFTNAVKDSMSYNIAKGGDGGPGDSFRGAIKWFSSLSLEEKKVFHEKQAEKRCKGWYVSKINDTTETYIPNIAAWCRANNIDLSMPTVLNNPSHRLFRKQTKGWRIRKEGMPLLGPYVDKRKIGHENVACKGRTWTIVEGKRVWSSKENA